MLLFEKVSLNQCLAASVFFFFLLFQSANFVARKLFKNKNKNKSGTIKLTKKKKLNNKAFNGFAQSIASCTIKKIKLNSQKCSSVKKKKLKFVENLFRVNYTE